MEPATEAGRILLTEHSSGTPHMKKHILAIEREARGLDVTHEDRVHPGCEHVRWVHPQDGPCSVPDCDCERFE